MDIFKNLRDLIVDAIDTYIITNDEGAITAPIDADLRNQVVSLAEEAYAVGIKRCDCHTAATQVLEDLIEGYVVGGHTLVAGDIVLLRGQADASQNGLWEISLTDPPTRPINYNTQIRRTGLIVYRDGVSLTIYKSTDDGAVVTISEFTGGGGASDGGIVTSNYGSDVTCTDGVFLSVAGRAAINGDCYINTYQSRHRMWVRSAGSWVDMGYIYGSRTLDPDAIRDWYGNTIVLEAGEDMAFGDVCHIDGGLTYKCKNTEERVASVMCVEATLISGGTGRFLVSGVVKNDDWAWGAGAIWVGETGGTGETIVQPMPTPYGRINQIVGVAVTEQKMIFRPTFTWIELYDEQPN